MPTSHETPYIKFTIEDGILYAVYNENVDVDIEVAKHVVETRLKFTEGKSYSCLIDMRGIKSATKEARDYLADEGAKGIIVCALVTGNVFTRTLAHLFLTVNKPPVPIRLFGNTESAKDWLKKFAETERV